MSSSSPGGVSPEGRLLSFVDWSTQRGELAVMEIATGKRRRLTHKPLEDESWYSVDYSIFSPDGKKLAFARWNDNGTFDIRIINVDGSGERVLLNWPDGYDFRPDDWTADAKSILGVLQKSDKTNSIASVSAVDGSFRIIREFDKSYPGKLSLSSDGRWIAYDFPQDEKFDKRNIFLLSENGSREIPLFKHPADDRLLGWTPGGDWILFSSDRSGTWDAWIVPIGDGKPEGDPLLVKRDFGQELEPMGFTQDGSFFFVDRIWLEDIYAVEIDTEKTKILRPPKKMAQRFEGSNWGPVWSPDGQSLAYLSRREPEGLKSTAICIKNMNTEEEVELFPKFKSYRRLCWFPDGKSFLVSGTDENNQTGLFKVDVKTGHIDLVVTGESVCHSPRCSPDGGQLVFYEGFDDTLKLISADGGKPQVLLKLEEEGINSVAWSADGKDIFFSKVIKGGKTGECELWRIPSAGGEPAKFELTAGGLINLDIHPEGSLLAFTLWNVDEKVWVMENFLPKK
jgi:Tol biopolymer transport system component